MSYTAKLNNLRVAPRKARLVANLVRGLPVAVAEDVLRLTNKHSAPLFLKLLRSAIDNMTTHSTVAVERLYIDRLLVDEGTTMRRFLPKARGRASIVRKRMSHITIDLKER